MNSRRTASHRSDWTCSSEVPRTMESVLISVLFSALPAGGLSTTLDTQGYDKNTVFWYRTKITVPEKHERLALFFGEVDGKAEVYVNGEKIAAPEKIP